MSDHDTKKLREHTVMDAQSLDILNTSDIVAAQLKSEEAAHKLLTRKLDKVHMGHALARETQNAIQDMEYIATINK